MRQQLTNYKYGVEIIEGLPGSGKSFYATKRVVEVLQEYRRPVYTNLPLKWKVIRQYLRNRGGESLANLIRPLKEEHWRNFLKRQHQYALFREKRGGIKPSELPIDQVQELSAIIGRHVDKICQQQKISSTQMLKWFEYHHGLPIYEGDKANSIPMTSIIVIDEVQHWHPMLKQKNDPDGEHLQAYLTMCRHHLHWIWVISQDRSRINIIFRLLAHSVWRVWDRGEDRLAWKIRFKHLGIRAMGYERYTKDQLEGRNHEDVEPSESFAILPQRRRNRVIFRFYDSWTQAGSMRQMKKALRQARTQAGLDKDGMTNTEKQQRAELQQQKKEQEPMFIRTIKTTLKLIVLIIVCTVAFTIGQSTAPTQPIMEITNATQEEPQHEWPTFNGVTPTAAILNGQPAKTGSKHGAATLTYFNPDTTSIVYRYDGGFWMQRLGETKPNPVGSIEAVQTAVASLQANSGLTPDQAFRDAPTNTGETLGTP